MKTNLGQIGIGLAWLLLISCTDDDPTGDAGAVGGGGVSTAGSAGRAGSGHAGLAGGPISGAAGSLAGSAAVTTGGSTNKAGAGGANNAAGSVGLGGAGTAGAPSAGKAGAAGVAQAGHAGTAGAGGNAASLCPAPQAGPTVHPAQDVTRDEVWTADSGPHIVTGNVSISARLTIEACARVEVAADVALSVEEQGTLAAEGEPARPVVITGGDAGRWDNIYVAKTARLEMANTTIERAGADAGTYSGCSVVLDGDLVFPPVPMAQLQNVRIVGSAGYGLCLRGTAALDASSNNLEINGSGAESTTSAVLQDARCPLWISAEALRSVPVGSYTGNALDAICVDVQSDIVGEVTVQDRGVPYYLYYGGWPSLTVSEGAALNLGPGVTFKFDPLMALKVTGGGTLRVEGTVDRPAVLTSMASSPAPGGWVGVMFYGAYSASNRIDHARIENAGADCSCVGFSCHSEFYPNEAAVIFLGDPASSSFITNTTFANISGHGINRGWQSDATPPDFTASNTFTNVSLCAQTMPMPETRDCPEVLVCP